MGESRFSVSRVGSLACSPVHRDIAGVARRILEAGYTGEYWREVAGFRPELSKRECGQVLDILDMYRVITFSVQQLEKDGVTVGDGLRSQLEFKGFDYNDGLEGHMATNRYGKRYKPRTVTIGDLQCIC